MVKVEQNRIRLLSKIKLIQQDSFYNDRELPKLIAVSKKQPNQKIIEALDCGQKTFGENRVQEADKLAWYDIIQSTNIGNYANVHPVPDQENVFLQSLLWS